MNQQQVAAVFGNAIMRGATGRAVSSAGRVKARRELRDAQVEALRAAIGAIQTRARNTPAWAHGYNSAITAIELQIAEIISAA